MTVKAWIKKSTKNIRLLLLALILTIAAAVPAFAATSTKITSVKVTVLEENITPGTRYGTENIDIDVDSGHYYFDYYEIVDDGYEWKADQVPKISIHLRVDDPDKYYFSTTLKKNFTVVGATYVNNTLKTTDSGNELYFTVELTPLDEKVADITEVVLNDSGYAYWDAPIGAGSYELRVYRDDSLVGTTDIKTEDTEYNLQNYMNRAGSYYVRVRACNSKKPENKSEWVESDIVMIDAARAGEIRDGLSFTRPLKGDWEHTDAGWIYRYEDGSTAAPGWASIDGHWFYFDPDGFMATGWRTIDGLDYYFNDVTGSLLTNTTTPDGFKVDANGNKKTD